MKIACIGDVHANLHALDAVLADAERRGAERIWHTGDLVGYGALPEQVIGRIRQRGIPGVIGNYDRKALAVKKKGKKWRKHKHPQKRLAFEYAHREMSRASRKYLAGLPEHLRMNELGWRILVAHGSPDSISEVLGAETPEQRLRALFESADADILIVGHSHRPCYRKLGEMHLINTGSTGRPEGDPRACYALLELTTGDLRVQHVHVRYDVHGAVEAIREAGLPEEFAWMLLEGADLVTVAARRTLPGPRLGKRRKAALAAARELARRCEPDELGHAEQVTRLALRLFDCLRPLHGLGEKARFWLHCAGLLHDIGWARGLSGHHRNSMQMILESEQLPFGARRRLVVANIARYHRKALPSADHAAFAALDPARQEAVRLLAGILRVADGLDVRHADVVWDLDCQIAEDRISIRCLTSLPAGPEIHKALAKSDLLEEVLGRRIFIQHQKAAERTDLQEHAPGRSARGSRRVRQVEKEERLKRRQKTKA
ncbi:MAG: metallophosphoesterase family protein [Deltaproteobacteria bacterium]|nr:metallophosphoesterase family protein [Deltaproteobacteria bacterium]